MPDLLVSTIAAGLLAILMFPLSFSVSLKRVKLGNVVFGDAGDETLRRRIRAHGNFIEYASLGLAALVILEYQVGGNLFIWILGSLLVFSRYLHAAGMLFSSNALPRALAMLASHFFFLATGLYLLAVAISKLAA